MRGLLLAVAIVVVGSLTFIAVRESFRSAAEPALGLTTPVVRGDLRVEVMDAARQSGWPCDASQMPDRGWSCIVVQVALENQGAVVRGYDAHHFRLEDRTRYQYPRHLPAHYFPTIGSPPLGQGTLTPGGGIQGTVWFAAPRSRGPFTLVYQPPAAAAEPSRVLLPEPMHEWR